MCSTLYGHYIYDDDDAHNPKLDGDHCTICMCSRLLPTKIPSWRKITIIAISQGIIFDKVYCHALLKYFHISFLLPLMWLLKWIICWWWCWCHQNGSKVIPWLTIMMILIAMLISRSLVKGLRSRWWWWGEWLHQGYPENPLQDYDGDDDRWSMTHQGHPENP